MMVVFDTRPTFQWNAVANRAVTKIINCTFISDSKKVIT